MRIISGSLRGRIIKSPGRGNEVRPTTDRARETLFNILFNRYDFTDRNCLDLFCGTGSLGLEFLSRGGGHCTFVDLNTETVKENINALGMQDKSEFKRSDAIRYLESVINGRFDFIFADPPYKYDHYGKIIEKSSLLSTRLIIEHDKFFSVPDEFREKVFLNKKIGISNFTFFDFTKKL
jgi:16S rRNA (guanine966-N2)-methyltransferase